MIIRRRLGQLLFCFLGAVALAGCGHAQVSADSPTDLTAALESIRARHEIPGMVAVVLRGDRIIARGAVGVRKQGATERVTLDDLFHLGSCTKAMTATLAALLIQEGKLDWTTTLDDLFGHTVKEMRPSWRNVTLQQVLAHRAGFRSGNDVWALLGAGEIGSITSVSEMRKLLVAKQLSQEPESTPGTRESYSNIGFIVVGAALEKITGRTWEELMQERLFKPLGITTAGFGAPGTPAMINHPWGHNAKGEPVDPGNVRSDLPPYAGPAGTVHINVDDWAKFVSLHLEGDSANPNRRVHLLNAKTFDALHRLMPGGVFSGGWAFDTVEFASDAGPGVRLKILGHSGSNSLWYSKVLMAPQKDLAVLVLCNRGGDAFGGKAVDEASIDLLRTFASIANVK
jgi:CubicO group peptidase (beta-lactamase class C family)